MPRQPSHFKVRTSLAHHEKMSAVYNNNDLFVIPEWNMVVVRLGLDQRDRAIGDKVYSTFLGKIGETIIAPPKGH